MTSNNAFVTLFSFIDKLERSNNIEHSDPKEEITTNKLENKWPILKPFKCSKCDFSTVAKFN